MNRYMSLARSVARNVATEARTSKLVADMAGEDGEGGVWRQTATDYLAALRRIFVLEDQPAWPVHLRSRAVLRKAPKLHFVDPSLAAAALRASPEHLIADIKALGLLFESLAVRDLRVYAQPDQASVYHYRDSDNLEVDAIVARDDGAWLAVEIKLGHRPDTVGQAAKSLLRLREKVAAPPVRPRRAGRGHGAGPRLPPSRRNPRGPHHRTRPLTHVGQRLVGDPRPAYGRRGQGRVPNSGRSVRVRLSSQKPATFIMATRASHMASESSLGGTRVMTGPK